MIELPIIQSAVTRVPVVYYRRKVKEVFYGNKLPYKVCEIPDKDLSDGERNVLDEYVKTYYEFRERVTEVVDDLYVNGKLKTADVVKTHHFDYADYLSDIEIGKRSLDEDMKEYPFMFPFKDDEQSMQLLSHLYRLENISNALLP